jgi:hypothetical protein
MLFGRIADCDDMHVIAPSKLPHMGAKDWNTPIHLVGTESRHDQA